MQAFPSCYYYSPKRNSQINLIHVNLDSRVGDMAQHNAHPVTFWRIAQPFLVIISVAGSSKLGLLRGIAKFIGTNKGFSARLLAME